MLTKSTDEGRENQPLPHWFEGNRKGWPNLFSICIYVSPSKCAYCSIDGNHRDLLVSGGQGQYLQPLSRSYCGSADDIFVHLYWREVQFLWSTPIVHLNFAFFCGVFIAPVAAFVQYILLYGLQNHSVNLEESLAFDEVTLSTIASHILLSLFLSFVVAALFEETCKRLMVDSWTSFNLTYLKFHQNEKKYYQNNHQYNVRNDYLRCQRNPNNIYKDPLQTLLMFHFVGLGFSVI